MCCAQSGVLLPAIAQIIRQTKPDRLLIEPSGLGHPAGECIRHLGSGNICTTAPALDKHSCHIRRTLSPAYTRRAAAAIQGQCLQNAPQQWVGPGCDLQAICHHLTRPPSAVGSYNLPVDIHNTRSHCTQHRLCSNPLCRLIGHSARTTSGIIPATKCHRVPGKSQLNNRCRGSKPPKQAHHVLSYLATHTHHAPGQPCTRQQRHVPTRF